MTSLSKQQLLEQRISKLEEEVKALSDFANLSSEWFWEQDAEFRFIRFFGRTTEKIRRNQHLFIGKRRWEMDIQGVTEEDLQAHIDCYKDLKSFRDFEYETLGHGGELQCYSVSGAPVFNANNECTGYRGTGRNVTALKNAIRSAEESQQQVLQILLGSPIATFVINAEHKLTHWNLACESLTGVSATEVLGTSETWRGFYPGARPSMANLVIEPSPEALMRNHYGDKFHKSHLIPDAYEGEAFFAEMGDQGLWLHFGASPLRDTTGNIIGAIETIQDVTARVLAEQTERKHFKELQTSHLELKETMQELVDAKKLAGLGSLVAGVGHELNTPLGNILMGLGVAQAGLDDFCSSFDNSQLTRSLLDKFVENSRQSNTVIQTNLERCISLVNRFRDMASDQHHETPSDFSPHQTVNHVLSLLESANSKNKILFVNQLPTELIIHNYEEAFHQIILSLVENSMRHGIPDGGEVMISCTQRNHYIDFSICDSGQGMDDEALNHAFDPFFSSQLGKGSSGLGLYRVYNLIKVVMGGTVSIENLPSGLCVRFSIVNLPE